MRRGVFFAIWEMVIHLRAHCTTEDGSPTSTFSRWNYCTAANFPEIGFDRLRSDSQHNDARWTKTQALWLSESFDSENSIHFINLRNVRYDR